MIVHLVLMPRVGMLMLIQFVHVMGMPMTAAYVIVFMLMFMVMAVSMGMAVRMRMLCPIGVMMGMLMFMAVFVLVAVGMGMIIFHALASFCVMPAETLTGASIGSPWSRFRLGICPFTKSRLVATLTHDQCAICARELPDRPRRAKTIPDQGHCKNIPKTGAFPPHNNRTAVFS